MTLQAYNIGGLDFLLANTRVDMRPVRLSRRGGQTDSALAGGYQVRAGGSGQITSANWFTDPELKPDLLPTMHLWGPWYGLYGTRSVRDAMLRWYPSERLGAGFFTLLGKPNTCAASYTY